MRRRQNPRRLSPPSLQGSTENVFQTYEIPSHELVYHPQPRYVYNPDPNQALDLSIRNNPPVANVLQANIEPATRNRARVTPGLPLTTFQGFSGTTEMSPPTITYRSTVNTAYYPYIPFSPRAYWEYMNLPFTVTSQTSNMLHYPNQQDYMWIPGTFPPPQALQPRDIYNPTNQAAISYFCGQLQPPPLLSRNPQSSPKKRKKRMPGHHSDTKNNSREPMSSGAKKNVPDDNQNHFLSQAGPAQVPAQARSNQEGSGTIQELNVTSTAGAVNPTAVKKNVKGIETNSENDSHILFAYLQKDTETKTDNIDNISATNTNVQNTIDANLENVSNASPTYSQENVEIKPENVTVSATNVRKTIETKSENISNVWPTYTQENVEAKSDNVDNVSATNMQKTIGIKSQNVSNVLSTCIQENVETKSENVSNVLPTYMQETETKSKNNSHVLPSYYLNGPPKKPYNARLDGPYTKRRKTISLAVYTSILENMGYCDLKVGRERQANLLRGFKNDLPLNGIKHDMDQPPPLRKIAFTRGNIAFVERPHTSEQNTTVSVITNNEENQKSKESKDDSALLDVAQQPPPLLEKIENIASNTVVAECSGISKNNFQDSTAHEATANREISVDTKDMSSSENNGVNLEMDQPPPLRKIAFIRGNIAFVERSRTSEQNTFVSVITKNEVNLKTRESQDDQALLDATKQPPPLRKIQNIRSNTAVSPVAECSGISRNNSQDTTVNETTASEEIIVDTKNTQSSSENNGVNLDIDQPPPLKKIAFIRGNIAFVERSRTSKQNTSVSVITKNEVNLKTRESKDDQAFLDATEQPPHLRKNQNITNSTAVAECSAISKNSSQNTTANETTVNKEISVDTKDIESSSENNGLNLDMDQPPSSTSRNKPFLKQGNINSDMKHPPPLAKVTLVKRTNNDYVSALQKSVIKQEISDDLEQPPPLRKIKYIIGNTGYVERLRKNSTNDETKKTVKNAQGDSLKEEDELSDEQPLVIKTRPSKKRKRCDNDDNVPLLQKDAALPRKMWPMWPALKKGELANIVSKRQQEEKPESSNRASVIQENPVFGKETVRIVVDDEPIRTPYDDRQDFRAMKPVPSDKEPVSYNKQCFVDNKTIFLELNPIYIDGKMIFPSSKLMVCLPNNVHIKMEPISVYQTAGNIGGQRKGLKEVDVPKKKPIGTSSTPLQKGLVNNREVARTVAPIGNNPTLLQNENIEVARPPPLEPMWLLHILAHDPQIEDFITGRPFTNNGEDSGSSYEYYRLTAFQLAHLRAIDDDRFWKAYILDEVMLDAAGVLEAMPERRDELEAFSRELIIEALRRDYKVQDVETLRLCVINYLKKYPEYKLPLLERLIKDRQKIE